LNLVLDSFDSLLNVNDLNSMLFNFSLKIHQLWFDSLLNLFLTYFKIFNSSSHLGFFSLKLRDSLETIIFELLNLILQSLNSNFFLIDLVLYFINSIVKILKVLISINNMGFVNDLFNLLL